MNRLLMLGSCLFWVAMVGAQQAVLYTGSDWNMAEGALRAEWASPDFAKTAGVSLAVVDAPEVVDEAVQKTWEAQEAIRINPSRIPAVAWFDAKGRCVLLREGLMAPDADTARQVLAAFVQEGRAREQQIADLLAQETADGAGQALALVIPELGVRRSRDAKGLKAAWELLKAKDPEDATGWDFGLTFTAEGDPCYKVQDFVKKGDLEGGEAYIKTWEAKPQTHLSANQRQGLMFLRYLLWKGDEAKHDACIKLLREILAIDAQTHFGFAAQGLLCANGNGEVSVPYGWFAKDVPAAGVQTWELMVGVPRVLRAPGRYMLTIRREQGQGTMRVEGLEVSGETFGAGTEIEAWKSADIPFEWKGETPAKLTLKVAFSEPGPEERGRFFLVPRLAVRTIRPDAPIDRTATPWAPRKGEPIVATYARHVIPEEAFTEIVAQPGGAAFLKDFFADTDWMEDFFASGEPLKGWATALKALDVMVYTCPEIRDSAVLRRWAAAAALNAEEDPTESVRLLQVMFELRAAGQFVRGADAMRCDAMRFTLLPKQCDADNARWLAAHHCVPPRQYGGVCWAAPYRLHNVFGDSIHGNHYYTPWEHIYLRHERAVKVGGVCGALSYYGSAAAKTHGVPSSPGGQPSHCAYAVWSPTKQQWELAYNVNPYTWMHFDVWGGRGRFSYLDLTGQLFAHEDFRESMRLLWRAEVARLGRKPEAQKTYDPKLVRRYRAALAMCPMNYAAWRQYGAWLKACSNVPRREWESFARTAAEGLNGHIEPAWEFLADTALPAIHEQGGEEALHRALVALHGILRQGDWKTAEFCNYERVLNEQAKMVENAPNVVFDFFAADLSTQFGTADAFGRLMRWGGDRFLGDEAFARRYVATLNALLKKHGNEDNALGRHLRGAILGASKAGNHEAFRSLCALQDALEPPKAREPIDFSALADAPLLSDKAVLRLSTTSHWDAPQIYHHVIDGLTSEWAFHTAKEKTPHAEVILPGMAEVSTVYLRNRQGNPDRLVPFVVEVSEDGKVWQTVASATEVREDYTFTFKPIKAKFVRVQCQPEETTFLHLRKFCVFGKKLY